MGRDQGRRGSSRPPGRNGRGLPEQAKLWEHVRATKVAKDEVTSNVGNTAEAMAKDGAKNLKATYDFAIHTHGSIGPSCAIAEFKDGKLTSWSASQATHNLRKQLAKMFALPPENVRCIYVEGSGCYGRNGHEDAAADAALLAKAVGQAGARAVVARRRARLGPEGPADADRPARQRSTPPATSRPGNGSSSSRSRRRPASWCRWWRRRSRGMPADDHIAPGNVFQNSTIPYKFPNIKTVCHRLETTPFRPSWIRTPGRMQNTYANECFIDELAAAANADPIEFRVKYLDPTTSAASRCSTAWPRSPSGRSGPSPQKAASGNVVKGRGVTYCQIRAGAHLYRRRRRGRGRPHDRRDPGGEVLPSPTTAGRSSIPTA